MGVNRKHAKAHAKVGQRGRAGKREVPGGVGCTHALAAPGHRCPWCREVVG